ncbi:electron transport complex subunit RsxC [Buchnera aphidicola]|uniref:electron transport complex subunit RsxC n=1 Tax=Buchnera aphidicola TaxID=9 RepID=UPI00346398EC
MHFLFNIFFIKYYKKIKNFIKKKINKKKYNFSGGIKCVNLKNNPEEYFLNYFPNPKEFYIYIKYDHFKKNNLRVQVGQKVLCGQPLIFGSNKTVPVHSPTSGWIKNIDFDSNISNTNQKKIKIIILSDYLDNWIRLKTIKNYTKYSPTKLIKIIDQSGIIGLGGGGFSSAEKLRLSLNKVHTLIVNAVESDPCITADYCLIKNCIHEILIGCKIVAWISKVKCILIAIQEDKLELILKIQNLIKDISLFKICILKKKYPGGSSKILIKSLIGIDIPSGKHSLDLGYLIFNITTIYAIKRSIINGEPLIHRIITFHNEDKKVFSKNFFIKIGVPIDFILNYLKIDIKNKIIYSGGVFMKDIITNSDYSIQKNTNCIYIKKKDKKIIEYPCINCGYCVELCPVNLLPQEIFIYCKSSDSQKLKKLHFLDCIECKICEKVCPSNIPLVKYFIDQKKIESSINLEKKRKELFSYLFKKREKRLLSEKKIFSSENQLINIKKTNIYSEIKDLSKQSIINKKNIRKKMLKDAIKRAKIKNKILK